MLQGAQLVDDVQAVAAAERPEVQDDESAAQVGEGERSGNVEPGGARTELRRSYPWTRHALVNRTCPAGVPAGHWVWQRCARYSSGRRLAAASSSCCIDGDALRSASSNSRLLRRWRSLRARRL